ncbi:immunoglobulin domain-containing family protein [Hyalangium gracile]|uniref:hypothetical protein n=1 Tax=Hyalangium gracile TaxID=394092 RepID=UPI001CCAFD1C|nr:hypothetical protein [Hyalangium gracile]
MNPGQALRSLLVPWLLVTAVVVGGCTDEEVQVSILPASATVSAGDSFLFTTEVKGADDPSVTWSVPAGDAAGTITDAGLYTAPMTAGTYEVKATSVADPTRSATATVTVLPPTSVAVTVTPGPVSVRRDGRQTFSATVTGTEDRRVTWRVQEGAAGGTINSDGTYSAPASAGTFHVEATSVADPRAKGSVTVTVTTTGVASVTLAPINPTVVSGQFLPFSGVVYGVQYTTPIQWSVVEPQGGGITSGGLYLAPLREGLFHITAAARGDTGKRAQTLVDVQQPTGISVWIAPRSPSVPPGGQQSFTASVSGTPNQGVTWSVRETGGGTITDGGIYTAPQLTGTGASYTIVATSTADPTKRAEIAVQVTSQLAFSVAINPSTITLRPGASTVFSASVSADAGNVGYTPTLIWRVLESGGGTINASGNYTAPSTPGIYHVAAEASTASQPSKLNDTFATVKVE